MCSRRSFDCFHVVNRLSGFLLAGWGWLDAGSDLKDEPTTTKMMNESLIDPKIFPLEYHGGLISASFSLSDA